MAKQSRSRGWLTLGLCLSLGGCGAADNEGIRDGNNPGGGGAGGASGASGAGAGGAGGAAGLDIDMPGAPMDFGGGGGAAGMNMCQEGVFCEPMDPDGEGCGTLRLEGEVSKVPGNVLLVFDRSFSMDMDWNGMLRWQAAGTAMVDSLTPLAADLTIGMIGFPSPDAMAFGLNCTVLGIDSPDQIAFKPGADALAELSTGGAMGVPKYDAMRPSDVSPSAGATPTAEAIAMADQALNAATLTGATAVVIITDGEPNCQWADPTMMAEATTNATIARWLSEKNIKTYVVGLPGVGGVGPTILEALATSGGTAPYLTPTNSMELAMKMGEIISSTVGFNSCTITLNPMADQVDKLQMVVEEPAVVGQQQVPRDLGNGAGWSISPDGLTVELLGQVCEDAKSGRFTALTFEYGCIELPPIVIKPPD
jgi:hypothetical protein